MMKSHWFALTAPLLFVFLAACDIGAPVAVTFEIPCPLPVPVITDTLAFNDTYNGLCAYWWSDGDSLHFVQPGTVG